MAGAKRNTPGRSRPNAYRLRKRLPLIILLGLLAILAVADRMGLFGPDGPAVQAVKPTEAEDRLKYDGKTFPVVKAIDGDTFDIAPPDGEDKHTRIRLWGVDTPETWHRDGSGPDHFGPEASTFTRDKTLGQDVRVELEPGGNTRGTHGRLLAWVYLPDGRLLNALLVEEGYAYADPRFAHHRRRQLQRLQSRARAAARGLWKDLRPADLPDYFDGKLPD